MDSRLDRRIKWWKEQLKRKRKSKQEDFDEASRGVDETPQKKQGKKRKQKEVNSELDSEPVVDDTTPIPKHKKRRKETVSEDTEESETKDTDGAKSASKNETKKKYILFVGNIPFSATVEDIVEHFQRAGIKVDTFRLLTKKSGSSKGCGFMELTSSKQHQSALKLLHHTKFGDRRINVELSCGGGGKTEERAEKIKTKNKRVQRQRLKRRKKKTESKNITDD